MFSDRKPCYTTILCRNHGNNELMKIMVSWWELEEPFSGSFKEGDVYWRGKGLRKRRVGLIEARLIKAREDDLWFGVCS